jgi:hypothetical protein
MVLHRKITHLGPRFGLGENLPLGAFAVKLEHIHSAQPFHGVLERYWVIRPSGHSREVECNEPSDPKASSARPLSAPTLARKYSALIGKQCAERLGTSESFGS